MRNYILFLSFILLYSCSGERSREASLENKAREDIDHIIGRAVLFQLDSGKYPEQINDLVEKPANGKKWNQYLDEIPMDPWGEAYRLIRVPPSELRVDGVLRKRIGATMKVSSSGPDKLHGTNDDLSSSDRKGIDYH